MGKGNWVVFGTTNLNFLIPICATIDILNLDCLIYQNSQCQISKVYDIWFKDIGFGLENQSLWQRLNSFAPQCQHFQYNYKQKSKNFIKKQWKKYLNNNITLLINHPENTADYYFMKCQEINIQYLTVNSL